jgi:hypothetical protein
MSQLLCIILFLITIINSIKEKKVTLPLGSTQLLIWTAILLLFTFNTVYPTINIGYHAWLIFNIIMVFAFTQIINKENKGIILKIYILSFVAMAIVGILECIISIIGINVPFITQWWIKGMLPRINGFSFEPSYYATYMLIGWTTVRILMLNEKNNKKENILLISASSIIFITIILSSSRIGIAFMIGVEGIIFIRNLYYTIKKKDEWAKKYVIAITIIAIVVIIVMCISVKNMDLKFLLQGTGIGGTSAHSVSERESNLLNVIEVFKKSPILGKGLGGIYAEMAANKGLNPADVESQNVATGICIFAEVLAASGIIGFAVFIWYIIKLILNPFKLSKKVDNNNKYLLKALTYALIVELVILQFNQNILRQYLWLHIAMLSAYYNVIKGEMNK